MVSGMDQQKGALLAWMSVIFFNRDARNKWERKDWLPDDPTLGHFLRTSSDFPWTEDCYDEVLLLGSAAGYPFSTFLERLELPTNTFGSCFANPVTLDTTSTGSDSISTESGSSFLGPETISAGSVHGVGDGRQVQDRSTSGNPAACPADVPETEPGNAIGFADLSYRTSQHAVDGPFPNADADEETREDESKGSIRDFVGGGSIGS